MASFPWLRRVTRENECGWVMDGPLKRKGTIWKVPSILQGRTVRSQGGYQKKLWKGLKNKTWTRKFWNRHWDSTYFKKKWMYRWCNSRLRGLFHASFWCFFHTTPWSDVSNVKVLSSAVERPDRAGWVVFCPNVDGSEIPRANHLGCIPNPVNNGIIYQPQLVSRIFWTINSRKYSDWTKFSLFALNSTDTDVSLFINNSYVYVLPWKLTARKLNIIPLKRNTLPNLQVHFFCFMFIFWSVLHFPVYLFMDFKSITL